MKGNFIPAIVGALLVSAGVAWAVDYSLGNREGTFTTGNCVKWTSRGGLTDSGGTCGGTGAPPAGSTHSIQGNGGSGAFEGIGPLTDGQVVVGQTGVAALPKTISGDATLSAGGALTVTKTGGVAFATIATSGSSSDLVGVVPSSKGGAGTVNGLLKANGSGLTTAAVVSVDYAPATTGSSILKASSGGFANATSGTDYAPATSGSAILKGNGAGGFSSAASGTDYAPATSGSALLKGNGAGGFSSAAAGTDYAAATSGAANLPIFTNGAGGFTNGTRSGNTTQVVTATGTLTSNNLTKFDASGNVVDAVIAAKFAQAALTVVGMNNFGGL